MGKTLDLPDPLEKATPLPAPSADELLAQLAGDEIDRLLAEADARPEPATPPAPAPKGKLVDPSTDPELALELDGLFNQLKSDEPSGTTPVAAPTAPTAIPAEDAQLRGEIDALYNPVVDQPPPAMLSAAVAPVTPAAPMSVVARQSVPDDGGFSAALQSLDPTSAADPSSQTTALEQQVLASEDLMKAAIEAAMPAHPADVPPEAAAVSETAAVPATHRSFGPLAWVSNAFSDATLDALGKVAILTLINALAILIYVVVFRKH